MDCRAAAPRGRGGRAPGVVAMAGTARRHSMKACSGFAIARDRRLHGHLFSHPLDDEGDQLGCGDAARSKKEGLRLDAPVPDIGEEGARPPRRRWKASTQAGKRRPRPGEAPDHIEASADPYRRLHLRSLERRYAALRRGNRRTALQLGQTGGAAAHRSPSIPASDGNTASTSTGPGASSRNSVGESSPR